MTTTERAAEVVEQWQDDHPFAEASPNDIAQYLADAGLLAAPVDGELRHGLLRTTDEHRPTTPVQCLCGWRETDPDTALTWVEHQVDQVLPVIAAYVAEEKRKLREEIEAEIRAMRVDLHGAISESSPHAIHDQAARIARGDA